MKERRKFKRLPKNESTVFQKGDGQSQEGKVLDISTGGMKIVLDNDPKIGSSIIGQFEILPGMGHFYACGEVVWVKPGEGKAKDFEVGIKFNKVSTIPL